MINQSIFYDIADVSYEGYIFIFILIFHFSFIYIVY